MLKLVVENVDMNQQKKKVLLLLQQQYEIECLCCIEMNINRGAMVLVAHNLVQTIYRRKCG